MKTRLHASSSLSLLPSAMCVAMLLTPGVGFAADFDGSLKEVQITDAAGSNQPPTAVISTTQNGDTFTFNAGGSRDTDGNITAYRWNFGDGASASGSTTTHQFAPGTYNVTLTVIDNQGSVGITLQTVELKPAVKIAVNFQPASAPVPDGYEMDSGLAYSTAKGYGWKVASFKDMFDRNNPESPDQSYDTVINVYPDAVWEVAVPNGQYQVTVLVGDPSYPYAINSVQIENQQLIQKETTSNTTVKFIKKTGQFLVQDGALSVTFLNSQPIAKLCSIVIEQTN